jgi:hypothetical protein
LAFASISNCVFWGNVSGTTIGGGLHGEDATINRSRRGEIITHEIPGIKSRYPGDPDARRTIPATYKTLRVNAPNIIQGGVDGLELVSSIANDLWQYDDEYDASGNVLRKVERDPDRSPLEYVIAADPLFVDPNDPDGPDNLWFTKDDGLQLQAGSPAIDAGFDDERAGYETIDSEWIADVLGYRRIQEVAIDIGPFESYESKPLFPLEWASTTDHGLSWKSFDWFGYYYVAFTEWVNWMGYDPNSIKGWIYHADYGWIYRVSPNIDDIWLFHPTLGWLWTNQYVFPYLYRADSGDWIYFHPPSTAQWEGHTHADPHDPPPPPVYYDFGLAEWLPLEN